MKTYVGQSLYLGDLPTVGEHQAVIWFKIRHCLTEAQFLNGLVEEPAERFGQELNGPKSWIWLDQPLLEHPLSGSFHIIEIQGLGKVQVRPPEEAMTVVSQARFLIGELNCEVTNISNEFVSKVHVYQVRRMETAPGVKYGVFRPIAELIVPIGLHEDYEEIWIDFKVLPRF